MKKCIAMAFVSLFIVVALAGCGGNPANPVDPASSPATVTPTLASPPTVQTSGSSEPTAAPTESEGTESGTGGSSSPAGSMDGCALLRGAGVESVFGKSLKEPAPAPHPGEAVASCKWTFDPGDGSPNPGTLILQLYSPADESAADFYARLRDTVAEGAKTVQEPVPGMGEKSMWGASELMGNLVAATDNGLVVYLTGFKATDMNKVSAVAKGVIAELRH